jgi:hypothetical protein
MLTTTTPLDETAPIVCECCAALGVDDTPATTVRPESEGGNFGFVPGSYPGGVPLCADCADCTDRLGAAID